MSKAVTNRPVGAKGEEGFTLLEVMVALAVLAIALTAISTAQHSAMHHSVYVYKGQLAAMLIRGTVLDIEQEYLAEGFPENSIEDRECDLEDPYDDMFECKYDLVRMDLEPDQLTSIVDQSFGGLLGEGGLGSLEAGGEMSATMEGLVSGNSKLASQVDFSKLAFLMPLLGPEGPALMDLCGINLSGMMMGFMGMQAIAPKILSEVGNRTRKLTVTLSWKDGPLASRDFSITTFVTALPEEELKKLDALEGAAELLQQGTGTAPTTEPTTGEEGRQ